MGLCALVFSLALTLGAGSVWAQEPAPAEGATPEGTSTATSAEPTGADPAAEQKAAEHATKGKELYAGGQYVEALLEFKQANKLAPTAALLWNIAQCREKLSQWTEAIDAYEKFSQATENPRDRADAQDRIAFLKTKLGPGAGDPYEAKIAAGRDKYRAGDYEGAIAQFKAAYDIKALPGPLYNIGKSYEQMARYEEAIDYYQQYLDQAPNAGDRQNVEENIRRLKKSIRERFQELSIASEPPGADIYLDDRNTGLLGQTNSRFKVQPGPHTIYLDKNGFEPVKREFVMPDDKPLALDITLEALKDIGEVSIQVNVDGARIFVDGAIIGLSPYTQKKQLSSGDHQVTVEAVGFPRHTQSFIVQKDQDQVIDIQLEEYSAPVSGDTLSAWGRNLVIVGLIGGTLGVLGPFIYQKLVLRKDSFETVGPSVQEVVWGTGVDPKVFWDGTTTRSNSEADTLKNIQLYSIIGGSVFVAAGMSFYMWKWFRAEKKVSVVTAGLEPNDDAPFVQIESFGITPTPTGASMGLSGRF